MTDFAGLLNRLLALLELKVEFKKISRGSDLFVVRVTVEDLSATGQGKSRSEARQRAAKDLLAKVLDFYHDDLLLALQVEKLAVLRQQPASLRD